MKLTAQQWEKIIKLGCVAFVMLLRGWSQEMAEVYVDLHFTKKDNREQLQKSSSDLESIS